jgi:hypothetical protein
MFLSTFSSAFACVRITPVCEEEEGGAVEVHNAD